MNRVESINRGMNENFKPLDSVEIPSLQGKVSEEEWAIRVELACAYRMVAYYGWDDLIFTHLSARIPGRNRSGTESSRVWLMRSAQVSR